MYINPEGVRVENREQFEGMQEEMVRLQRKGFSGVLMGDFNVHIGLGQKLVSFVWACDMRVGKELPECTGRWTWECGEKKSVIDYVLVSREVNVHKMVIEDEGAVDLGSDHNLIWCVVGQTKAEKVIQEERYKWKVNGTQDWEEYQHAVQEEFLDWKEKLEDLAESSEKERWVEGVWELWNI